MPQDLLLDPRQTTADTTYPKHRMSTFGELAANLTSGSALTSQEI